jgi:hypothetical protein
MQKIERYLVKPLEELIKKYPLLIIILLSIPSFAALFHKGFYGASDDLHIAWLHEMHEAIKTGQFPPRFVPDLSFGFGYPLFNFVFPLPFYIAEIFHLGGFSLVDSIKTVFLLSLPLSGVSMYLLLRRFSRPILALAGGILYIYTPYRSTDVYVRGAIGEAVAFVFLPLAILSVFKLSDERGQSKWWVGLLGFSTAFLVLSHNIMSYMFLPFLVLLGIIIFLSKRKTAFATPFVFKTLFGFILGLLISLFFWLPAIWESRLMKQDTVFNFIDHFPTLKQLITPHFGYGASVAGPYDGMSFFIGTINLLLIALGIFLILLKRKKFTQEQIILSLWSIVSFLVAIFMMNFRSTPLWQTVPYLPYFQFPWRFLSLTTLITPLLIVLLDKYKLSFYFGIAVVVLAIILNFNYFKPHDFLERQDDYYLNRYIPTPGASEEYKKTGEEYLRLPNATSIRPQINSRGVSINTGILQNVNYENALEITFDTNSTSKINVNYERYNFPGWKALVDGNSTAIFSGQPFGQITFDIPPGKHKVDVKFGETNFRLLADVISLLSLFGAATIMITNYKHAKKN